MFTPPLDDDKPEPYRVRPAMEDDIPTLQQLYDRQCAGKLMTHMRSESMWRYNLNADPHDALAEAYFVILDTDDEIVGYYGTWGDMPWGRRIIREFSVREGIPVNAVVPSLLRDIQDYVIENDASFGSAPPTTVKFDLGFDETHQHPVYKVLDAQLTTYRGWSWYVRVADIPGFLIHIKSVLERRLAASEMSGFDGELTISFYQSGVRLVFEQGQLVTALDWTSPTIDTGYDAAFPPHTFLQLLFGYRSLAELRYAFADCWVNRKSILLLNVLFPKQPSWAIY